MVQTFKSTDLLFIAFHSAENKKQNVSYCNKLQYLSALIRQREGGEGEEEGMVKIIIYYVFPGC